MIRYFFAVLSIVVFMLSLEVFSQQQTQNSDYLKTRGIDLYNSSKYKDAAEWLRSYIKKVKEDPEALYYLGLATHKNGKPKDARKAFIKLLQLQPNQNQGLAIISYYDLLSDKLDQPKRNAETALKTNNANIDALFVLGVIHFKQSDFTNSKATIDRLLDINKEHSPAWHLKSSICLAQHDLYVDKQFAASIKESKSSKINNNGENKGNIIRIDISNEYLNDAAKSIETYLNLPIDKNSRNTWAKTLDTVKAEIKYINENGSVENIYPLSDVTIKPIFTYKEKARYTDEARANKVNGTVTLSVILHRSGKVKYIRIIRGLPHGLTEQALLAARNIRFIPGIKDGKQVSVTTNVQFFFSIY